MASTPHRIGGDHEKGRNIPTAEGMPLRSVDPQTEVGTRSPQMRRLHAVASRVAPLEATVLITGESGVGKERLARFVHARSRRAPFVAVNCGAISEALLESELFGHVRGAFTGAVHDRVGLFEAAHGGTLFLDEIGDVSLGLQVKLLRVLQEREVRRVGDIHTRRLDVRVIAATNKDLLDEVEHHRFRRDLYYRLQVIDLHVPPLRERPDDLHALADEFLTRTAHRMRGVVMTFAPQALDRIRQYTWPGNIRELEHAIERACAVAVGPEIQVDDLPSAVRDAPTSAHDGQPLRLLERDHIVAVLERHDGHRRRTAEALGISLSTLKRKLRRAHGARS